MATPPELDADAAEAEWAEADGLDAIDARNQADQSTASADT
jgi:hypothetical protein